MKNQITITWNADNSEETRLSYSRGWKELSNLEKADNLKDAIYELEGLYNDILEEGIV